MMAEFTTVEVANHFGIDRTVITKLVSTKHLQGVQVPDRTVPRGYRWKVVAESMDAIGEAIKKHCPRVGRVVSGEKPPTYNKQAASLPTSAKLETMLSRKDDLFAIEEVAKVLGRNSTTLYGFIHREKLPLPTKVGGRSFVNRETILKMKEYYVKPQPVVATTALAVASEPAQAAALSIRLTSVEGRLINRSIASEEKIMQRIDALTSEVEALSKMVKSVFAQLGGDVH